MDCEIMLFSGCRNAHYKLATPKLMSRVLHLEADEVRAAKLLDRLSYSSHSYFEGNVLLEPVNALHAEQRCP